MPKRPNLLHLLLVPLIIMLVCNGISTAILWQFSSGLIHFWQNAALLVMGLYGVYLMWRTRARPDWRVALCVIAALVINYWTVPGFLWFGAMAVLFSGARLSLLRGSTSALPADLLAALVGLAAALFLVPASLTAAVAAFVLVQLIYEMRRGEIVTAPLGADRFREGLRTAERILADYR